MVDFKKLRLISIAGLAAMAIGCTGTLTQTGDGDGDGDGDVDAAQATAERMMFESMVRPLISAARDQALGGKPTCDVCHSGTAAPTLFGSDTGLANAYDALIMGDDLSSPAAGSALLIRGDHDGNAWCTGAAAPNEYCTLNEVGIITTWIEAEITAGRVN